MTVKFTVFGAPQGKARHRTAHHGTRTIAYTPLKTAVYEDTIKLEYRRQCGHKFPAKTPLRVSVLAFCPIPKSASKRTKQGMEAGEIYPTVKPDWDNVGKIICDALNGIAYHDDAQVVSATVDKRYGVEPMVCCVISDEVNSK